MNLFGLKTPVISAELGINHGGDMELAKEMMKAAKECGCDTVKVQYYRVGDFVKNREGRIQLKRADGSFYLTPEWKLFSQCELTFNQLVYLKQYADNIGIHFHGTPTSSAGVRDLVKLNMLPIKIGSEEAMDDYLIKSAVSEPMIVSVGCLTPAAWHRLFQADNPVSDYLTSQRLPLYCVREYPATIPDAAMENIRILKGIANIKNAGFSDHTLGIEAAVSAVKDYGAVWIEKHFTLDKDADGPDHWWSADPKEMAELCQRVKSD